MEHLFGPARHVDTVVFAPLDEKISRLYVDRNFPFGPTGQHTSNANRRGARAASPGLSAPRSHTRILTSLGLCILINSVFTRFGKKG